MSDLTETVKPVEPGSVFGSFRVVVHWGSMAAGKTWVVQCTRCGEVGKRLGTHLRQGYRIECRTCTPDRTRKLRRRYVNKCSLPGLVRELGVAVERLAAKRRGAEEQQLRVVAELLSDALAHCPNVPTGALELR